MSKYTKTVIIFSPLCFDALQVGNWFKWAGAPDAGRGQWLGKTRAGVDAVRYQQDKFGKLSDTTRNKLVRAWAKQNGAK